MAEIKNTFLKGKMNQDLDARLVPNGEYREATNLQISRSEGSTVGEFENILGDLVVASTGDATIKIIGYFSDTANNIIYFFATDHYSNSSPVLRASATENCRIYSYNIDTNVLILLVDGYWLNLNQAYPIYGINLVEDLLFWTDNLNQPRKINVTTANPTPLITPTYYFNEDQVSVAKYYPYQPIVVMERFGFTIDGASSTDTITLDLLTTDIQVGDIVTDAVKTGTIVIDSLVTVIQIKSSYVVKLSKAITVTDGFRIDFSRPSMENQANPYVSDYSLIESYAVSGGTVGASITISTSLLNSTPTIGMYVTCPDSAAKIGSSGVGATPDNTGVITSVTISGTDTLITLDVTNTLSSLTPYPDIVIGTNPNYDASWKGDPDLLKQKYIRFSYRIKFVDNEYSLMAPFSQILFIPEQYGEFGKGINTQLEDMNSAYKSTIVSWMQNNVDSIILRMPIPKVINAGQSLITPTNATELINCLHIKSIDVLYKESNSLAVKVLDTVQVSSSTIFTSILYDDLVNFNTVKFIDYNYESSKPYKTLPENQTVRVYDKVPVQALSQEVIGNRVVYGNYVDKHTSPLAANYGVVIADKSVVYDNYTQFPNSSLKENRTYQVGLILSDRYGRQSNVILSTNDDNPDQPGSTIFSPYKKYLSNDVFNWLGDALRITFNAAIPVGDGSMSSGPGEFTTVNPLGWFSYKTVVKQQEQDYYNVYLPGFVNGYPVTQDLEQNQTVFTTLTGDNVNKVPRDLTEVTGQQTQFNSSVRLFGRVNNPDINNKQTGTPIIPYTDHQLPWNQQYYPGISSEFVRNITTTQDGEIQTSPFKGGIPEADFSNSVGSIPWGTTPGGVGNDEMEPLYSGDANPYYAELSVGQRVLETNNLDAVNASRNRSNQLGAICTVNAAGSSGNIITMQPFLTVSETNPTVSLLDIFWETSSTGSLVDLNSTINAQYEGLVTTTDTALSFFESAEPETPVDASFSFLDGGGTPRTPTSAVITTILDNQGNSVDTDTFELRNNGNGTYGLYTGDLLTTGLDAYFWYGTTSPQVNNYNITFTTVFTAGNTITYTNTISTMNVLVKNVTPSTLVGNQCPITLSGTDAPSVNDTTIFNFITGQTVGDPPVANYGKWVNGSADVTNYQQELIFSIISQTDTSGAINIFEFTTPSNGILTVRSSTTLVTGETYTINVGVTDNNGIVTGVSPYTGIQGNCSISFTVGAQHINRAPCNGPVLPQANIGCGNYRQIWAFVNSASEAGTTGGLGAYPSTGIPTIFYGTSNSYTYYNVANKYSGTIVGTTTNGGLNSGASLYITPTLRFTNPGAISQKNGNIYYTIQHRTNAQSSWTQAVYYKIQQGTGTIVTTTGTVGTANYLSGEYLSGGFTDYKTKYWFDVTGEYRVLTSYLQGQICSSAQSSTATFFPDFGDGEYELQCSLGPL